SQMSARTTQSPSSDTGPQSVMVLTNIRAKTAKACSGMSHRQTDNLAMSLSRAFAPILEHTPEQ
ncbi:MAG: hypothetical protein MUQ30_19865, partial [Anaerolineae bacterium]|nr:hypothetical protein [Anaerolineae bacterium]